MDKLFFVKIAKCEDESVTDINAYSRFLLHSRSDIQTSYMIVEKLEIHSARTLSQSTVIIAIYSFASTAHS
jgi:hypothetical protein